MQTSSSYPELVNEELHKYDGEVCKYFQVDRRQNVVSVMSIKKKTSWEINFFYTFTCNFMIWEQVQFFGAIS